MKFNLPMFVNGIPTTIHVFLRCVKLILILIFMESIYVAVIKIIGEICQLYILVLRI